MSSKNLVPSEKIEKHIYFIREQKVMLDFHLSDLYGVDTKALKRAVRRNVERFPNDFMFELNSAEYENLKRQIGTSSWGEPTTQQTQCTLSLSL